MSSSKPLTLNRNSTNFPLELFEIFKKTKWEHKYDFLKYYQNLVRSYITRIDVDARGLLAYLTMGLGKSMLAVAVAIDLMDTYAPIILLTKSLQKNMHGAIKKYIKLRTEYEPEYPLGALDDAARDQWIADHFSFVSMNASNMLKQMSRAAEGRVVEEFDAVLEKKFGELMKNASLDGKLLIVDEVHNFFRAITNGSKNAIGLYDMIMKSKNLKLLFLTGTPIANDPFELVPCFNMLAGRHPILPEDYRDFYNLFVDRENGRIKNREKFQNRIFGLVSHVNNKSRPGSAFGIDDQSTRAEFPEEKPIIVERVNMDPDQYVVYGLARDKERDEGSGFGGRTGDPAPLTKPRGKEAGTYRVRSRQLSNYCPPAGFREGPVEAIPGDKLESPKYRTLYRNIMGHVDELGIVYSQFTGLGGLGPFARYLDIHGWAPAQIPAASGGYIERVSAELARSMRTGDQSTGDIGEGFNIGDSLSGDSPNDDNLPGDRNIHGGADRPRYYAIISGDVDVDVRDTIANTFNSNDNAHGGIIDLLLISATGAEGLDLKNVRHIHVLEPYWNWGRVRQVISRGVRNDSHIYLPPDERNVQPYIYLAIPPEGERLPDGGYPPTTDVELYDESIMQEVTTESFNDALKAVSIECLANGEEGCRVCSPSSERLFTEDIRRDIRAADPCCAVRETHISAQEIVVDGVKYYYAPDDKSIYNYRIFSYDEKINGYRAMKESDPRYEDIIARIDS